MFKQFIWTLSFFYAYMCQILGFSPAAVQFRTLNSKFIRNCSNQRAKDEKSELLTHTPFKLNRKTKGGGGIERGARPQTHRKAVVDVLGAGLSHTGISQVHLMPVPDCPPLSLNPSQACENYMDPSDSTRPTADGTQGSRGSSRPFLSPGSSLVTGTSEVRDTSSHEST